MSAGSAAQERSATLIRAPAIRAWALIRRARKPGGRSSAAMSEPKASDPRRLCAHFGQVSLGFNANQANLSGIPSTLGELSAPISS